MIVSLIVAMDRNGLIGKDNALPWRLPADLAYFKRRTLGKPIIMGRKTFESIGKPLPGRLNIVLTRHGMAVPDGVEVVSSTFEALRAASRTGADEVMIIGGAEIYAAFLPAANRIYRTLVHGDFTGNVYFPTLDFSEWPLVNAEHRTVDDKNAHPCDFETRERIRSS